MAADDAYGGFVPFRQSREPSRSPLFASADLGVGGTIQVALGAPGSGKSTLLYRLAHARHTRERVWIRGTLDDTWYHLWGPKAVVWLPAGAEVEATLSAPTVAPRHADNLDLRRWDPTDPRRLVVNAPRDRANVVYGTPDEWVRFIRELTLRPERDYELFLDDEVGRIAPDRASRDDYFRVSRFMEALADARKANLSGLLASQQHFDMSYVVIGKAHSFHFLLGARVPKWVANARGFSNLLHKLERGHGICVGVTPEGLLWEDYYFPAPPRGRLTLVVRVSDHRGESEE